MLNAIFLAFLAPQIIKTHLHQIYKILKILALSYSGILSLTSYYSKMLEFFNIFFFFCLSHSLMCRAFLLLFSLSFSFSDHCFPLSFPFSFSNHHTLLFSPLEYHVHCKLKLSDNRCCKLHLCISKILDETQTRTTSFRDQNNMNGLGFGFKIRCTVMTST